MTKAEATFNGKRGVWRTVGGRRIFIATGQSLSEAMMESGKFKVNKDETKEYVLADDETINKMQQQSNEIYNNYDKDKISDLNKYTSGFGYYKDITRSLERNKGDIDEIFESDKKIVKSIDDLSEKMALEKDTILYRGAKAEHFYKYIVGDEITMHSFPSTSLKEETADKFIRSVKSKGKEPLKMIIKAPKGTKGIYVGENTLAPDNEYEFILKRGLKYRVADIITGDNERTMILEVLK